MPWNFSTASILILTIRRLVSKTTMTEKMNLTACFALKSR